MIVGYEKEYAVLELMRSLIPDRRNPYFPSSLGVSALLGLFCSLDGGFVSARTVVFSRTFCFDSAFSLFLKK